MKPQIQVSPECFLICIRNFVNQKKSSLQFSTALPDPQKGAIYDTIGAKVLERDLPAPAYASSALVFRYCTAQEIIEEYERQMRERQESLIERETNPKANMTVNINATEIFNRTQD